MRRVVAAAIMVASAALAAVGSPAAAQWSPCIPSGVGAAPYTGDWTHLPRDQRIALCEEGERRERARQAEQKKAEAARDAKKASEPAVPEPPRAEASRPEPGAAPSPPVSDPPRPAPRGPILRGTDASGVPILTDDPNLLRRR